MKEDKRYTAITQPAKCPSCGSSKVVPILWGYPAPGTEEAAAAGEIYLGGCLVGDDDPDWRCLDCNTDIYCDSAKS